MKRSNNEYRFEVREAMRGGAGQVKIEHLWEAGSELKANTRMFGRLTLKAGSSIGFHAHEGEEEVFYIVKGHAQADDNGKIVELFPGDTLLTGNGAGHSVKSVGPEDLEMIAVISKY